MPTGGCWHPGPGAGRTSARSNGPRLAGGPGRFGLAAVQIASACPAVQIWCGLSGCPDLFGSSSPPPSCDRFHGRRALSRCLRSPRGHRAPTLTRHTDRRAGWGQGAGADRVGFVCRSCCVAGRRFLRAAFVRAGSSAGRRLRSFGALAGLVAALCRPAARGGAAHGDAGRHFKGSPCATRTP
jgi:hypothetical protein